MEELEDDLNVGNFVQGSVSQKNIYGAIIMVFSIFSQNLGSKFIF